MIRNKTTRSYVASVVMVAALIGIGGAYAQTVSYSLGLPEALLDANYYSGAAVNGESAVAGGRGAFFPASSNDGTQVAFYSLELDTITTAIFVVDIGDTSSWRRVTTIPAIGAPAPIVWVPDDSHVFTQSQRIRVSDGAGQGVPFDFSLDASGLFFSDSSAQPDGAGTLAVGIADESLFLGFAGDNIAAGPITLSGLIPVGSSGRTITLFPVGTVLHSTNLSPTLDAVAFSVQVADTADPATLPDERDIYLLTGVQALLADAVDANDIALTAPTSLNDPRIIKIRSIADGGKKYAGVPVISQDGALMLYAEDQNDRYNNTDPAGSFPNANFDIVLSATDDTAVSGANSNNDLVFPAAGNQFVSGITPGGLRLLINIEGAVPLGDNIVINTFVVTSDIAGSGTSMNNVDVNVDTDGDGFDDAVINSDNVLEISSVTPVMVEDTSGTTIELPPAQVIEFPAGSTTQDIVIETPISPVTTAQLPPTASVDAMPIVRDFGPTGTNFFPPINITITYTDLEIVGLDEATLAPFLFNSVSGIFDIPVPASDIVLRDTVNNTITFKVDHFSTYGLGAKAVPATPASTDYALALAAALLSLAGAFYIYRRTYKTA